jgi:hypothetical protein
VANDWAPRPPQPPRYAALVTSWYYLYLDRAPDEHGLWDFVGRLRQGATPEAIQASIMGSAEYYRLHGLRDRSWVAALYTDVLGRSPSPREVLGWLQSLQRLGGSRETTAQEFLRVAKDELAQRGP